MPATPAMRTISLKRDGREVRELTTVLGGRRTTFRFPYVTNNQQEIEYLLSRGAQVKMVPVVLQARKPASVPIGPANPNKDKPLKGGDEK